MERVYVWCIMCMSVVAPSAADSSGMSVFVNRVRLEDTEGHRVHYWFAPDDVVDILCVDLYGIYGVALHYQFGDEIIGGNGSYTSSSWVNIVGLRTRLRAAHNGSSVTCRSEYRPSITVQLLMRDSFDGVLDVKANAVLMRYQQASDPASHSYLVQYFRVQNESLTLECNTSLNNVVVQAFKGDRLLPYSRVKIVPGEYSPITYVVHNNATVLRNVTIQYFLVSLYAHTLPLRMNTTNTLELYDLHGAHDIYYNYDEGETLTLNCSTTVERMSTDKYILVFDNTVSYASHYIVKKLKLKGEGRKVECVLYSRDFNNKLNRIRVLFRSKARLAGTHGTVPVTIGVFFGIGVTCLACVFALAFGASLAWRWRRTLARRRAARVTAAIQMSRIQNRRLPQRPFIHEYDYVYNEGVYEEIPAAMIRASSHEREAPPAAGDLARGQCATIEEEPAAEQTQQSDDPGVQNTLYYWLSSSSSLCSADGDGHS